MRPFHFSCSKDEEDLIHFIESKTNFTKYFKELLRRDMNGELKTPENFKSLEDLEELKLEKIKLDVEEKKTKIELSPIKKRKLEAETKIKEYHAEHLDVIGTTPSYAAKKAMNYHVNSPKIVQKDKSFRCPRCQRRFAESEIYKQVDKLYSHMKNDHYSEYTEEERAEILAVIEN